MTFRNWIRKLFGLKTEAVAAAAAKSEPKEGYCRGETASVENSPDAENCSDRRKAAKLPRREDKYPPDATSRAVMNLIHRGRNLFITGGAGVGKSYLLHQLKQELKEKLHVTSTTGISALNVGGQTLHSWACIGIANKRVDTVIAYIRENQTLKKILTDCEIVAIDEISMLDDYTFDYIDNVLKGVRGNNRPFGGIQVLIFGDFFQLPPVKMQQNNRHYCFMSQTWKELDLYPVILKTVKRQSDKAMATALNHLRIGKIREEDIQLFQQREVPPAKALPENVLQIFGANKDADALNLMKLHALSAKSFYYQSQDNFHRYSGADDRKSTIDITRGGIISLSETEKKIWDEFDRDCRAPQLLELRLGCRVMLLSNIDLKGRLVNGTCGTVTKLEENNIEVLFDGHSRPRAVLKENFDCMRAGKVVIDRTQYPLRLAYGVTIHKSQGMTFDQLIVHMNKIFDYGQAYVALSRTRTLEGLYIRSFERQLIAADPKVIQFYADLSAGAVDLESCS